MISVRCLRRSPNRRPRSAARGYDGGQTSAEYLGVICVVVVLIGGLGLSGPVLGRQIGAGILAAVCRITGGNCTVPPSTPQVPEAECEVLNHGGEVNASVTVFSVQIGGSAKVALSKGIDADGKAHWYVQQEGTVDGGVAAKLGGGAHVGDVGEGVQGEVKGLLTAGGGSKMEFPNEQAARDYITSLEHEVAKQGLAQGLGGPAAPLLKWGLDQVDGTRFNPPAPKEYFFEGGSTVAGSLEGTAGVAKVSGDASATAVVGVKVEPQAANDGGGNNTTYYVKVSAEAVGKLGLFNAVDGRVGPDGEVVVGITYDNKGAPIKASLEAAGGFSAGIGPGGESALVGQAGKGLAGAAAKKAAEDAAKLSGGTGLGGGVTAKLGIEIKLDRGNNLAVVADGLHSLGVPVLLGSGTPGGVGATDGVSGLFGLVTSGADGTSTTFTTYTSTNSGNTAGVSGGEGVEFGVEGGLTFTDQKIRTGSYYVPGQGFVTWEACGK